MQHHALSVRFRCRILLSRPVHPDNWFTETQYFARRFRSTSKTKFQKRPTGGFGNAFADGGYVRPKPAHQSRVKRPAHYEASSISIEDIPTYLGFKVADWSRLLKTRRRLEAFGIPWEDIPVLLQAFVNDVNEGLLTRPGIKEKYTLDRFTALDNMNFNCTDQALTNIFYSWASDPDYHSYLETVVSPSTIYGITKLFTAADQSYPADAYENARSLKRTFHVHVGPTNSGKTHHALRALAAAKSGVYAGPLRLLAHEVWERLNKGQIVPLGEPETEPDTETSINTAGEEGSSRPTVQKQGNPKYARQCNLLTGEEMKEVAVNASLLSCTIEMLACTRRYDVAVVDEIQMIGDRQRGGAWTRAVLGTYAKDIHLCGEETAIPIIEALAKETKDDVIIYRYERLTPLIVQNESLEGDLSRVQKGDCLVAFSRSGIFGLKQRVEGLTGMRCAVAYGRLPPEIRSEQAALFNDPESGYDIMIGSDALGMGLNLYVSPSRQHVVQIA
jgi:ATP-dependent RNA helicase SUPV3L1/SUV3